MTSIIQKLRSYAKKVKDFCVYQILHADDPPHRLSLGLAIGTYSAFNPLFGLQMVINVSLAWMLKANKLVGLPIVWITNPLTIVPIYFPCYAMGCWLTGEKVTDGKIQQIQEGWQAMNADPATSYGDIIYFFWEQFYDIAVPLFVGCTLTGVTLAVIMYYTSYFLICKYRARKTE